MGGVGFEVLVIILLILANGVFAMAEIAIVSARKTRLQQQAAEGDRRAATALALANEPNDFLSTVQVGITLVGVLAGAFGGATLAEPLAEYLRTFPATARYAPAIALGAIVVAITYASLILGELVPKRLALQRPEKLAAILAPPMRLLSRLALPMVRLLSGSTSLVLRLLGARPAEESPVTEEEIKILLAQGTRAGMFEPAEQQLVERIFRFADRRVVSLMTPRTRITWLDLHDPADEQRRTIHDHPFSRYVVAEGDLDHWVGFVRAREVLAAHLATGSLDLRASLRQPLVVPESARALGLLERFKATGIHLALVIDEYGGIEGLVTLNDLLEAIVGELPAHGEAHEAAVVRRDDGSFLVSGAIEADDLKQLLAVPRLPAEERGDYRTLGGFVMRHLGRVPREGDRFDWGGYRFEIVDMDGYLVDKVLISAEVKPADEAPE